MRTYNQLSVVSEVLSNGVVPRIILATSLALGVAGFAGCDDKTAKDKSQATVAEPVAVAPAVAPTSGSASYVFSAADSKIAFTGAKVTGKHEGSFGTFKGAVQLAPGSLEKSSVNVDVDMASLTTDDPKLTGHLKTPDLFDVARFPQAHFVSTAIMAGGVKGATHTVTGNLELHGITKSITFPATLGIHGDQVDVTAEFSINRKDFGVVYPGMPDDLIKDELVIKLQIHGTKTGA